MRARRHPVPMDFITLPTGLAARDRGVPVSPQRAEAVIHSTSASFGSAAVLEYDNGGATGTRTGGRASPAEAGSNNVRDDRVQQRQQQSGSTTPGTRSPPTRSSPHHGSGFASASPLQSHEQQQQQLRASVVSRTGGSQPTVTLSPPIGSKSGSPATTSLVPLAGGAAPAGSNGGNTVRFVLVDDFNSPTAGAVETGTSAPTMMHAASGVPLIPEEIPPSPILYVLATNEGRDKMFKTMQYAFKMAVWALSKKALFPEGAEGFLDYWMSRLAGNIQTIRNGRQLFKLGRWIVTLFALETCIQRLLRKNAPEFAPRVRRVLEGLAAALAAMVRAPVALLTRRCEATGGASESPATRTRRDEATRRLRDDDGGEDAGGEDGEGGAAAQAAFSVVANPAALRGEASAAAALNKVSGDSGCAVSTDPATTAMETTAPGSPSYSPDEGPVSAHTMPFDRRRSPDDFSNPLMLAVGTRCAMSIFRNLLRDKIFLKGKFQVPFPSIIGSELGDQYAVHFSWLVISVLDFALNLTRLLDGGWTRSALASGRRLRCACADPLPPHERKKWCVFPNVDFNLGCPGTTGPQFLEAAPPSRLALVCSRCDHCMSPVQQPTRRAACLPSSMGASVSLAAQQQQSLGTVEHHQHHVSHFEVAVPLMQSQPKLFLPWLIRRMYSIVWCLREHSNFRETVLLQLKYAAELFLSVSFLKQAASFSLVDEPPVAEHLNVLRNLAGFVSAYVSLRRVYLEA